MPEEPNASPADVAPIILIGSKGRRVIEGDKRKIEKRDFRSPALLSEGDMRRLHARHTEFTRHFAAKVSAMLRLEFALTLSSIVTSPYAQFVAGLPEPAHLTLFKVAPAPEVGVLCLSPALGLMVTNRMLGGRGTVSGGSRALTEIEIGLLEDLLRMFVEDWRRQWPDLQDPRALLLGHETNGSFLQTSAPDASMLVVSLEATLGETPREKLQIAIPYAALEASIKRAQRPRDPRPDPVMDMAAIARRAACAGISLPAVAAWMVADVSLRDVLHLRPGDVLELPRAMLSQTHLSLTGGPMFIGTAGVRDGRVAVQLDRRLGEGEAGPKPGVEKFLPVFAH